MVKRRETNKPAPAPKAAAPRGDNDDLYDALGSSGGFEDTGFDSGFGDSTFGNDDDFFNDDGDPFADDAPKKRGRGGRGGRAAKAPRVPRSRNRRPAARGRVSIGRVLLNLLGALLIGALALVVFLAIGVGVNYALRQANIDLGDTLAQAGVPLPGDLIAADDAPASVEVAEAGESAETTATPDPLLSSVCPEADSWWAANQQVFASFAGLYYRVRFVPVSEDLTPLLEDARTRAEAAVAEETPCLLPASVQMQGGMLGTIRALETLQSGGDLTSSDTIADEAFDTLTATLPLLWDADVATDLTSPPALNVPRGGDASCSPAPEGVIGQWWAVAGPAWSDFRTQIAQVNLAGGQPGDVVATNALMQAARTAATEAPAEGCAQPLQNLLLNGMDSLISALNLGVSGETEPARISVGTYYANAAIIEAWLGWLGIAVA